MCRECHGYENEFSIENGILTIHKAYKDGKQLRLEIAKTKPISKYKYEVGSRIRNEKLDVVIIARVLGRPYGSKNKNKKYYIVMCNKCGCVTYKNEGSNTKSGCGVCGSRSDVVYTGYNDIAMTHPHLANQWHPTKNGSLLPTMVSYASSKEVWWLCDECGHGGSYDDWKTTISDRTRYNTGCPYCGDGMPYPEKLMALVLKALGIDFTRQLTYDNGQHKYDFYVVLWKAIFETHGIQHYEGWSYDKEDLIRQQNNDKYKHDDAINNHGILEENYNVVDCRYSTLEWCRPNIEKALSKYIDVSVLTDEDWVEFDKQAQKSLMVKVCKYWKESKEVDKEISVSNLVKEFGIGKTTIIGYLKWGNEKGLCEYDGEEERQARYKRCSKEVYIVKPKSNGEKWFDEPMSQHELARQSGITTTTISKCRRNGEPLSNSNGRVKYDPKYIGSYIMTVEDYNLKYGSN